MKKDEDTLFHDKQMMRFPLHSCELPPSPDRVFPALPPNASLWRRIRRVLHHLLVAWWKSRPLRVMRPSNVQFEYEQAHHARSNYWWVIHPMSMFYMVWQVILILSILMGLIVWPLLRAFGRWRTGIGSDDDEDNMPEWDPIDLDVIRKYEKTTSAFEKDLEKCIIAEIIIYWINIIITFNTGFIDKQSNCIEMMPSRIAKRYLKRAFILDVVTSCMYFEEGRSRIFYNVFNYPIMVSTPGYWFRTISYVIGIFHLFRIYQLIISLKNWFEFLSIPRTIRICLYTTLVYVICMHWMACLSVLIPVQITGKKLFSATSNSWMNDRNLFMLYANKSIREKYLVALSRVVRTSRGDLSKHTESGITMEDFSVLLAIIWFSNLLTYFIIAIIVEILGTKARPEIKYPQVMYEVKNYLRQRKLPVYLRHKILVYYAHVFQGRYLRPRAVLASMPNSMREAIKSASCHRLVAGSALFRNVPKSLVVSAIQCLKEEMYLPHDVVYTFKSEARYMFFLSTGTVALLAPTGEEVGHLEDGAYFGEMEMVSHVRGRIFSVVALEVCEMFLLSRKDFRRLFKSHPRLFNRLRAVSMQRASELMEWDEIMRRELSFTDENGSVDDSKSQETEQSTKSSKN